MPGKWVWPACGAIALAVITPFTAVASSDAITPDKLNPAPQTTTSPASEPRSTLVPRELWVWHPDADLVATAHAYGFTRLLVWVSPGFTDDPATLSTVHGIIAAAQPLGMSVDALCGDPEWAKRPELARVWAQEVARSGLFDRIHLDIEPHALPEWQADQQSLAAGLLTAIDAARAAGLPVDVDIPAWYHTISTPQGPLDAAVMQASDGVVIMAYRNTPEAVMAQAAPELATAARLGVRARVGVNLGAPGGDPAFTSFRGSSARQFWDAVATIERAGSTYTSWAGFALHDYRALSALAQAPE